MFLYNPLFYVFALPGLLLGLWAQSRVKGAFNKFSKVRTERGLTGAQIARMLLDSQGLQDVLIEESE
ncbi:MAG TPA: zinc metallopeptidase, partial [Candidatus Binatia bacterium]|nr:zinc metallopeptidase [Candidatus Binatia bacterium]